MATNRDIIKIDEDLCDGCGQCVTACAEGALVVENGKARVIEDRLCDGLGACVGECPRGALTVIRREAAPFDEAAVEARLHATKQAPLAHAAGACPSARMIHLSPSAAPGAIGAGGGPSRLGNWPVQIRLIRPDAPFLENADLLVLADCAATAVPDLHERLVKGKVVMMGCPKFDDGEFITGRFTEIFTRRAIRSLSIVFMEVPCCAGLPRLVLSALAASGKPIPVTRWVVSREGHVVEAPAPGGCPCSDP